MALSSGFTKKSGKGPRQSVGARRIWSPNEEQVLVNSLKEIIIQRWRCENGFKVGYLLALEKCMVKVFPHTDLKASPHIHSKIHVWKKNYGSLSLMLSRSGFGWNATTNMIIVESEDVWTQHCKTDSNAKGLKHKSFPFYFDWCEIFRKDRATGENAQDCNDAANANANDSPTQAPIPDKETSHNAAEKSIHEEADVDSVCQPGASGISKPSNGKKRKTSEGSNEKLVELMGTFCEQTNHRLREIAKRIGYEFDEVQSRKVVFDALSYVGGLRLSEQVYCAKLIVRKKEDLGLFFSLHDEGKAKMVSQIMSGLW